VSEAVLDTCRISDTSEDGIGKAVGTVVDKVTVMDPFSSHKSVLSFDSFPRVSSTVSMRCCFYIGGDIGE
jgi:hypothetical protein